MFYDTVVPVFAGLKRSPTDTGYCNRSSTLTPGIVAPGTYTELKMVSGFAVGFWEFRNYTKGFGTSMNIYLAELTQASGTEVHIMY